MNNNMMVTHQPAIKGNSVDVVNGLGLPAYDHIDITYPTSTTEHYVFKKGGAQVAVVDLTYSDSTKVSLTTVDRSA